MLTAMTRDDHPGTSAKPQQARRETLPLRPLTLWLPDTRAPGFAAEARRQSQQVSKGCGDDDLLQLLEGDLPWTDS